LSIRRSGAAVGAAVKIEERVQRVIILLESLNDPYPAPRIALVPESGPAASRYVPCETCHRRGEVRVHGGWQLCLLCDGRGERKREGAEPAWDAYLNMPLDEAAALPRASATTRTPILDGEEAFTWERIRARYDRHGSYRQLRRGLRWLEVVEPRRHSLVRAVHVDHEPRALSAPVERELHLGVLALTLRLGRVRVPPWLIEQTAADERRSTVAALAADGYSAGQIARRLGLSRRAVQRRLRS
jgi:hypothetical protein